MSKLVHIFQILFLILVLFSTGTAQEKNYNLTIEEIFTLPEDKIDIGIALLIMAKDAYPNLIIERFDQVIDYMANRLEILMQGQTDPLARITMMNTFLYKSGWWNDSITFTYDLDDLEASKTENQFLNGYLSTKKGSCVTMPMLHLVLADRLGWPIYAVRSPHHIFCRYISEDFKENNIDATCGGGYVPNERYVSDANIPDKAISNGAYLRTLSKREYLASMLLNNSRYQYEKQKNLKKAAYYTGLALSIDSTLSPAHCNLGRYYYLFAHDLETEMIEEIQTEKDIHYAMSIVRRNQSNIPNPVLQGKSSLILDSYRELTRTLKPSFEPAFQFKLPENINVSTQKIDPLEQNHKSQNLDAELMMEIDQIQDKYVPLIEEALARSKYHEEKAKELGIVLQFPDEFFIKQSKSIEKFKSTGKY